MAKNEIGEYSETDADNTEISGIGLSDATLIDQLDNIARAQMGALKRWFKSSLFRLRDSTDQTKLLAVDLSGLTTATTRTVAIPDSSGTLVYALQPQVSVASAATTDVGAAASENVLVTGTTTITSLGTAAAGTFRRLRFQDALTLTYNVSSLLLPGKADIVTTGDDVAEALSVGSGNWVVTSYQKANSLPAPQPKTTAGVGQFISFTGTSGAAFVLPADGTWVYWGYRFNGSGAFQAFASGQAAGGTSVGNGVGSDIWYGMTWRVA